MCTTGKLDGPKSLNLSLLNTYCYHQPHQIHPPAEKQKEIIMMIIRYRNEILRFLLFGQSLLMVFDFPMVVSVWLELVVNPRFRHEGTFQVSKHFIFTNETSSAIDPRVQKYVLGFLDLTAAPTHFTKLCFCFSHGLDLRFGDTFCSWICIYIWLIDDLVCCDCFVAFLQNQDDKFQFDPMLWMYKWTVNPFLLQQLQGQVLSPRRFQEHLLSYPIQHQRHHCPLQRLSHQF